MGEQEIKTWKVHFCVLYISVKSSQNYTSDALINLLLDAFCVGRLMARSSPVQIPVSGHEIPLTVQNHTCLGQLRTLNWP